jgi:hypothetical protein
MVLGTGFDDMNATAVLSTRRVRRRLAHGRIDAAVFGVQRRSQITVVFLRGDSWCLTLAPCRHSVPGTIAVAGAFQSATI